MTHSNFETLHIINKSMSDNALYQNLIQSAFSGDAIILIESAVYAIFDSKFIAISDLKLPIYVLKIDTDARGLTNKIAHDSALNNIITWVDDSEFVNLCCQYKRSISWF